VYVQSFPVPGGKWQVSVHGGSEPEWRPDERELFYVSAERDLMSVRLQPGSQLAAGVPEKLFNLPIPDFAPSFQNNYVVAANGQRFLVNTLIRDAATSPISVVLNWTVELKR
jgi:hypothetical protein